MKVGIVDADLLAKGNHRFPNLCSMKISAYHKNKGDSVTLLLDYNSVSSYDKVYVSKVFTATAVPEAVLQMETVEHGGTGFYYDKAPSLPASIEHMMPDYHLYDEWVEQQVKEGKKRKQFSYYLDYSIGYLTRGCFRKCYYCVNRNCSRSMPASKLEEFYDETRPKLCFLDDNFLACPRWKELIAPVVETKRRFQFKQGLDERLLTEDKLEYMKTWRYDGEFIFAFDNIEDKNLIVSKLKLASRVMPKKRMMFYVFCGCDKNSVYDKEFWEKDIENLFLRIFIIGHFKALPYVMRFEAVYKTEYSSFYAAVCSWCNRRDMFHCTTFRMYAQAKGMSARLYSQLGYDPAKYLQAGGKKGSSWRAMEMIEQRYPHIARKYFDTVAWSC